MIVIKRYKNRKFYNKQTGRYINLIDIHNLVKKDEEFVIIDVVSNRNITQETLVNVIFRNEILIREFPPVSVLREMLDNNQGNMTNYLLKLGVFTNEKVSLL